MIEGHKVTETLQVEVLDRSTVQAASDEPQLECAARSSATEASQTQKSRESAFSTAEGVPCEDDIGKFTSRPTVAEIADCTACIGDFGGGEFEGLGSA